MYYEGVAGTNPHSDNTSEALWFPSHPPVTIAEEYEITAAVGVRSAAQHHWRGRRGKKKTNDLFRSMGRKKMGSAQTGDPAVISKRRSQGHK